MHISSVKTINAWKNKNRLFIVYIKTVFYTNMNTTRRIPTLSARFLQLPAVNVFHSSNAVGEYSDTDVHDRGLGVS